MSDYYHSLIHLLFIGVIALFPVVNPIGSALIVNHYFTNLTKPEKRNAVMRITFYAFSLCTITLFAGHWILELFGITIPVIQVAGGIMICKTGWEFLSGGKPSGNDSDGTRKLTGKDDLQEKLFFPITFPITTGAGTMAVLFTLSAHSANDNFNNYLLNTAALMLSVIIMCAIVYFLYMNTGTLLRYTGSNGEKIINRIVAFLTFCVGLQIAVAGIKAIAKI
ncbi:MAG TPA: MarC family protein [Puia sp.]|nr:MarC family protein [Puia sp.]